MVGIYINSSEFVVPEKAITVEYVIDTAKGSLEVNDFAINYQQ
tara:strand:+ start:60 stop:188 length:129 start_codon:yes stop_codon:yes gene_type:complete